MSERRQIQKYPGNLNSEGKRKTVRVSGDSTIFGVHCKIQFSNLLIFSTSVYGAVQMKRQLFMIKRDLFVSPIKIKLF